MAIVNIFTESDADFIRGFLYQDKLGVPIDLTGASLRMYLRHRATDAAVELRLLSEDGTIEITDAAGGAFTIIIQQSALERLEPGEYVHSLIMTRGTAQSRIWSGMLTLTPGPSR